MKENQAPQFPARPRTELCYKLLMFTAAITGMALLSSFYPIYGNVPFIVIPSILTILFAKPVFFEKMKLTTLVVMRLLVVAAALRLFDPNIYVDLILVASTSWRPPLQTCSGTRKSGTAFRAWPWPWGSSPFTGPGFPTAPPPSAWTITW